MAKMTARGSHKVAEYRNGDNTVRYAWRSDGKFLRSIMIDSGYRKSWGTWSIRTMTTVTSLEMFRSFCDDCGMTEHK